MPERKRLTLKDLAAEIDVHYSTVSRVMNPATRHLVAEDVAARVLAVAEARGFSPNRIAAGLRTQRSGLIGVVLPDIANPVFPPILAGIEVVLAQQGYVPIVVNAGSDKGRQRFVIDQLLGRQVEGLVLATAEREDPVLEYCLARHVPVVTVNRGEGSNSVSSVVSDSVRAMQLTVDHLMELGHRRIGHIAGPASLSTGFLRREGFIQAVRRHRLRRADWHVVEASSYSRNAGRVACAQLMTVFPALTAIAAANDLVAMGCYDYLREQGLRCPDDISVIGHNDMPFVDALTPPLTTIRIAVHEMGEEAARLLLRKISKPASDPVTVQLQPHLIVRGSTAAPRKG
ncbi:LacI family DNA-binding transcriptional regulator [Cupriavidus taiwanensis]|uniref:Putative transcriptional regulator, lacI family n=1 Tax=Cupriavidus taiwanensis TaxID=164546 RepID=A0A7Z7NPD0_9BURK|nr:LacI family DNA-binding transcriptional regulator [Cupriavidus taiwanensis]SOZ10759.1 putative transcriptional regulator, lacI family [Cupriavidus taiwanensis]SOZ12939.1 putative transcriptional regulator, lacI family [Cupriavidus taiwanensis]SOZ41438.1 putative transcriptional regulator, lacI family [Cupriavidus taiwanensis]SPC23812.1 putative transcriptional regulator, lacI family [Cupriavidus taiwanensis]SPD54993.1 putative transcriptional regulator, lacI family [Cupriavidus taiwanensis]